jgi:transposase
MSAAVVVTRIEHTPAELRVFAGRSNEPSQTRRLLAIAMVLEGSSRLDAARRAGMDRQTLRDWVHRYNAGGIDALVSRKAPGAAPKLTQAQMAELHALVIAGPDPKTHKVIRWRCLDLCAEVSRRFAVTVPERTMGKWLGKLKLTPLAAPPASSEAGPGSAGGFKKTSVDRRSAYGGRNGSRYPQLEGSGRRVFGGFDPVKKRGPWAVADLRVVTPVGDPD